MFPPILIGLAAFFGCMIRARMMGERVLVTLSNEHKLYLVDGFTKQRRYAVLPLILVVFLLYGLRALPEGWMRPGAALLGLAVVAYLTWLSMKTLRKMQAMAFPEEFLRAYRGGQWWARIGWVCLFAGVVLNLPG